MPPWLNCTCEESSAQWEGVDALEVKSHITQFTLVSFFFWKRVNPMPVITKFPCYWELHQRLHTKPGGSWAAPANVYIPNILQKHPMELEQTSECALKKRKRKNFEYELLFGIYWSVLSFFSKRVLSEGAFWEMFSSHFPGGGGGGGNTTACWVYKPMPWSLSDTERLNHFQQGGDIVLGWIPFN